MQFLLLKSFCLRSNIKHSTHSFITIEVRQKYSTARRIFNYFIGVSPGVETLRLMLDILHQKIWTRVDPCGSQCCDTFFLTNTSMFSVVFMIIFLEKQNEMKRNETTNRRHFRIMNQLCVISSHSEITGMADEATAAPIVGRTIIS